MVLDLYPPRVTPVLGRMAHDVRERGVLSQRTARVMWSAYFVHATAMVVALVRSRDRVVVPTRLAGAAGGTAALAGVGLCVAGMGQFGGFRSLEGTQAQEMTSGGVYEWSRNPQYLGYLLVLGGASLARRSASGAALTALAALAYASWVRVEEQQLHDLYGESYDRYRARTHRWIGWIGR